MLHSCFARCFAPPSMRNLRSSFLAIQWLSPLLSWTFSHFQPISMTFSHHFQSLLWLGPIRGIYWQPEDGENNASEEIKNLETFLAGALYREFRELMPWKNPQKSLIISTNGRNTRIMMDFCGFFQGKSSEFAWVPEIPYTMHLLETSPKNVSVNVIETHSFPTKLKSVSVTFLM